MLPSERVFHYDQNYHNRTIAHEIGHFWGLCDQKLWNGKPSPLCDPNNQSLNIDTKSMMSYSTTVRHLVEDDKEGMRALAKRKDIPANAAWKKLLEESY